MPKLFLNNIQNIFLQETHYPTSEIKINTILRQTLEVMRKSDASYELKQVYTIVSTLLDKNKLAFQYMGPCIDVKYTNNSPIDLLFNSRGQSLFLSSINIVQEKSTKEVHVSTYSASGKNYYDLIHNHLPEVMSSFEAVIKRIEAKKYYVFNSNNDKYAGSAIITALHSVRTALCTVKVSTINFSSYPLKEFKGNRDVLEDKKLYYIIYDGKFVSLSKMRSNSSKFNWALTDNMDAAFLFRGDEEAYCLPYPSQMLNKVFVLVQVQAVQQKVSCSLTQELTERLENRDMNAQIDSIKNTATKLNKL